MQKTVELLKNAIEAEIRAQVFYAKAAELTNDDESRMVFIELAGMEEGHAQHLVDHFNKGPVAEATDLQAFLDETEADTDKLLEVVETPFVKDGSMDKVLDFAITQEHKARDNYIALIGKMVDSEDRRYCEELAQEEEEHAARLLKLRRSLDMADEERPGM